MKSKLPYLFHYGHGRAWFCSAACREGFREDRKVGLIYGPYWLPEHKRFAKCAEEMSALTLTCPYCNTKGQITKREATKEEEKKEAKKLLTIQ